MDGTHDDAGDQPVGPDPVDPFRGAPTPPHERVWRHPSEVGAQAWALSEPPVVLGRGLAATTAALSLALSAVLLLTMLPTHAGHGLVVTTLSADRLADEQQSAGDTSSSSPSTSVAVAPPVPDPVERPDTPLPTYRLQAADSGGTIVVSANDQPVTPVAVAIGDGALIITTAAAVDGRADVALLDPDGSIDVAHVLFVDDASGLAVLLPAGESSIDGIDVADAIRAGDTLTVPGHSGEPVVVAPPGLEPGSPVEDDQHLAALLDELVTSSGEPDEGDPVVNQRGELVALCTRGADGPTLVLVDRIAELRRALGALLRPTVWIGVLVEETGDGQLVVGAIDPEGPAAVAGLQVGDIIASVDATAVHGAIDLAGALAVHHVGDVVELGIVHTDGLAASISVTLAEPPPRL